MPVTAWSLLASANGSCPAQVHFIPAGYSATALIEISPSTCSTRLALFLFIYPLRHLLMNSTKNICAAKNTKTLWIVGFSIQQCSFDYLACSAFNQKCFFAVSLNAAWACFVYKFFGSFECVLPNFEMPLCLACLSILWFSTLRPLLWVDFLCSNSPTLQGFSLCLNTSPVCGQA